VTQEGEPTQPRDIAFGTEGMSQVREFRKPGSARGRQANRRPDRVWLYRSPGVFAEAIRRVSVIVTANKVTANRATPHKPS
jgi:hypothetical protein